jgi:hypothetical protein
MAGRKKASPVPPPDGARAFAVVVEQLRGEFRVFGEALGGLRQQVTEEVGGLRQQVTEEVGGLRQQVTEELGGLRQQVTEELGGLRQQVTEELGGLRQQMNDGFAAVERRFERVEHELGEVRVDLALVKSAATTHTRELKEIRSALGNKVERGEVEAIVEHAVARIAQR